MSYLLSIVAITTVGIAVVFLWWEMKHALDQLEERAKHLEVVISPDEIAEPDIRAMLQSAERELHRHGLKTLARSAPELVSEVTRARAYSLRAKISARIELMPQLGLLGTVAGLILTMILSPDGLFETLGLALVTTLVGLSAAVLAKWKVESQADELVSLIDYVSQSEEFQRRIRVSTEALNASDA